jgi:hypothetical protein
MSASPYKNTGQHAVDLDDGRVLEPGQIAEVETDKTKHPLAHHLVDTGQLTKVRLPEPATKTSTAKETS